MIFSKKELSIWVWALIVLLLFLVIGITTVPSTHLWVVSRFWEIQEKPLNAGLHFFNRITTDINKIDIRQNVVNIATETTSKEGLKFWIEIWVNYNVKPSKAVNLQKNLRKPLHEVVRAYVNATIDDVVTWKDKDQVYSDEGRKLIVNAVKEQLTKNLGDYAEINNIFLENITLPESITSAIQKQQAAQEKVKEEKQLLEVEKIKRMKRKEEAQGIAEANQIIANSLSKEYLQYESIQKLNPDAEKIIVPSNEWIPLILWK